PRSSAFFLILSVSSVRVIQFKNTVYFPDELLFIKFIGTDCHSQQSENRSSLVTTKQLAG
ncbi:MAG: hypothetical protein ACHQM6_10755, partial [Candidatus Kapaibacterium sp.]